MITLHVCEPKPEHGNRIYCVVRGWHSHVPLPNPFSLRWTCIHNHRPSFKYDGHGRYNVTLATQVVHAGLSYSTARAWVQAVENLMAFLYMFDEDRRASIVIHYSSGD